VDRLDGVTVELADGAWFNLRASNTEPLLRLNVEAATAAPETEVPGAASTCHLTRHDHISAVVCRR
jgi:phosphomannomutase